MDIKELILAKINKKGKIKTIELTKLSGFTRAYLNKFLQELEEEGKIVKFGHTKGSFYVPANLDALKTIKSNILKFSATIDNKDTSEDFILNKIKKETGIFFDLKPNVANILEYSFLEMVNNAIEHSKSEKIRVEIKKENNSIIFIVEDWGIGIFENIKNKFNLPNTLTAIQELLKGKKTTEPTQHSGQGIFFTSKLVDNLTIKSSDKTLIINNNINDLFIEDRKTQVGTTIIFSISLDTQKTNKEIFDSFSNQEYEFSKTQVKIKLFRVGKNILSRSEARRVMIGLESFQDVLLDFESVESIGQAFADEIFRVWQNNHQKTKITYTKANENVEFMIKRAL